MFIGCFELGRKPDPTAAKPALIRTEDDLSLMSILCTKNTL